MLFLHKLNKLRYIRIACLSQGHKKICQTGNFTNMFWVISQCLTTRSSSLASVGDILMERQFEIRMKLGFFFFFPVLPFISTVCMALFKNNRRHWLAPVYWILLQKATELGQRAVIYWIEDTKSTYANTNHSPLPLPFSWASVEFLPSTLTFDT